jgi:hypothetical protein
MKVWRFVGTGVLAVGTITGAALAASPTRGDLEEYCDHKAAQVSKAAPLRPGAGTTPPSTPPPGSNPTEGRVTDSPSGAAPSQLGVAPVGEEPVYRQTYLACIHERAK